MDFIEIVSRVATPFADNKLVYLHCVDLRATDTVQLDDFPCFEVKLVLGHITFPRKIAERRICGFLNGQNIRDVLKDRRSPVLIEVLNSCDIKSSGRALSVVVDFKIVPNSYPVTVKPKMDYDEEDPLASVPWLDVSVCDCNCSCFPRIGNVLVNGLDVPNENRDEIESSGDSESEEGESEEDNSGEIDFEDLIIDDDDVPEKYTEYFALKGSSFHKDCQTALKKCKELELKKQEIELRVNREPTNVRDKNAILVEAQLDGQWCRTGYIPREKIRKVNAAIKKNEIDNVKFKTIGFMFIPDLNDWLYQPRVLITKSHQWLPTEPFYKYNDNLE